MFEPTTAAKIIKTASDRYGYIIVAACFFIMTLAYGSLNTFGVFFKPMSTEFGWSRAATSGPFALNLVVGGLLSVAAGRLSDRFGPRIVVSCGAILLGSGYMLMSQVNDLWQLYFCYGLLVAAGSSTMYVPIVSVIARWFTQRRGLMSGIGVSGIGFGIGIMPIISSSLIQRFEWRTALLFIGVVLVGLICLLSQLLKDKAASPVPEGEPEKETVNILSRKSGLSFRDAIRTRQFWMIFLAWIGYGYFFQVGTVHIVPYASDIGMTALAAASILSIIGLVGTAGRIILGFIGDKFGNSKTILVSFVIMALAYLGLSISHSIAMLYIFAVFFGFLFGIGILLIPLIAEYFGFKALGSISGVMVFANSIGGAIGPPAAGAIFDAKGSYEGAFISCVAVAAATVFCIYLIKPIQK